MNIRWSFDLPTSGSSVDYDYESPIFINDNEVLFAFGYERSTVLYVVDTVTGMGKELSLSSSVGVLSKCFFFIPSSEGTVVYTGDLYQYRNGTIWNSCALLQYGKVISHLIVDDDLYVLCLKGQRTTLLCVEMKSLEIRWKHEVTSGCYFPGPLFLFENCITCYGCGELLFIEPKSGNVLHSIQIPRVDKLFSPIRIDDEYIAIGFTNWSNAGVLVYSTVSGKVKWKAGKRFEGPLLRCLIYNKEDYLYWIKNDRELICLDAKDGTERFCIPTLPWLYTELCLVGERIIYGTSGADGFLNCIRFDTGEKLWSLPLKNGCTYYGRYKDTVIVGDYSKTVFQIDVESGAILQQFCTTGKIVGSIAVCEDSFYTVVWGNEHKPISLVKIAFD